jgi:hypothetical protein
MQDDTKPQWINELEYAYDPDTMEGHADAFLDDPDLCDRIIPQKHDAYLAGWREGAIYREQLRELLATIRFGFYRVFVQGGEIDPTTTDEQEMLDEVYGPVEREMLAAIFHTAQKLTGSNRLEFEGDKLTFGEENGVGIVYSGAPSEPVGRESSR